MKFKKIISWVIVAVLLAAVTNKLMSNKAEMKVEAEMANIDADFIPVQMGTVQHKILKDEVKGNARLIAQDELTILSETTGKVQQIFKQEGDYVSKNEVIVSVEDDVYLAQYKLAKANFEKAEKDLKRFELLAKQNAVSEDQLEKMKVNFSKTEADFVNAKKQYENTKIKSPIAGQVNTRFAEEGMFINGGAKIAEVVNVNSFELQVMCSEEDVLKIEEGQDVQVQIPVLPGEVFTAKVKSIAVKADESMKYAVELRMKNTLKDKLKAGMLAEVSFTVESSSKALVIDRKALVGSVKDAKVFIVKEGKSVLREIELGRVFENLLEVKSGLHYNEKIVLSGQINLKDGTQVREI